MAEELSRNQRILIEGEGFEQRCRMRIQEELGVNPEGVEVILHLRKQVITLQLQLRDLQAELDANQQGRIRQITTYRQEIVEATWEENADKKGGRG